MRIALFTETWHPYTNGVITHISGLAAGLRALGHQVLIFTADPGTRRVFVDDGGVVKSPAWTLRRIYGYGLAAPVSKDRMALLKQFDPDVLHVHSEFGIGTFAARAALKLHRPLVYTLHTAYDDYLHYLAPPPMIPVVRSLSHRHVRWLSRQAQVVTGPSDKAGAYLKSIGAPCAFQCIPNSVEDQRFSLDTLSLEDRQRLRRTLAFPDTATVGLFVGRLGLEKNLHVLLDYFAEAVPRDKSIQLLIVGDGPQRAALESQAKALHREDQVTFLGKIPYESMPAYYAAADFYISASTTEMMSISMLEARAMGRPVVQMHDAVNRSQVVDGVNGFVFEDAATMARHILHLHAQTPAQRKALEKACADSMKDQGAKDLARRLLACYQEAMEIATAGRKGPFR